MRILALHDYYQQRGGEDVNFENETSLLEENGHQVIRHVVSNDEIDQMGRGELAIATIWNRRSHRELAAVIRRERPDLVHAHNTFPLLSPSILYAARSAGLPMVQTVQNYRLFCLKAVFFRDGRVCEDCVGRAVPWPGVLHACYRDDRAASAVTGAMLVAHRVARTWRRRVDLFIAVSEFARRKLVDDGLAPDRIAVKPNLVHPDPGPGPGDGKYALYVGRLAPEKGLATLASAWELVGDRLPLRIAGDGPLASAVAEAAARNASVTYLGPLQREEVMKEMGRATVLVFPSEWYETFGLVGAEAYARGTPIIASAIGAVAELVEEERTGLLFTPGDPASLAAAVIRFLDRFDGQGRMRSSAREAFERRFSPQANLAVLEALYERVLVAR